MDKKESLEKELNSIINESNDNIVVTDQNGIVLRVSERCAFAYGKEKSELIGRHVNELEEMGVFTPSVSKKVIETHKRYQLMQETLTGRIVMASGIPLFDSNNNLFRVISFSHDLTEIQDLKLDYEKLENQIMHVSSELDYYKHLEEKGIVIKSLEMKKAWDIVNLASKTDASVLFLGESGVGKSLLANALHVASDRKNYPFIDINCGAIPESLFESEMFGYEAGAFTGAHKSGKPGLIELANKGTLFLDEIAELPLDLQVKLLKVIEEKKVTRIGGTDSIAVDFRLITATNQNLKEKVKEKTFRQDLYYRLNVIPVEIPSLKNRKEDIYQLAQQFLTKYNQKYNRNKEFQVSTINNFTEYNWPGNVRELDNLVERLVIITEGKEIKYQFEQLNIEDETINQIGNWSFDIYKEEGVTLQEAFKNVEAVILKQAVEEKLSTYEMSKRLGISQPTVVRRLKALGDSK